MPHQPTFTERMTAKAGPLPVWVWAVVILVAGYVVYRRSSSSSSSSSPPAPSSNSTDATAPTTDTSTSGTPAADNAGGTDTQVGMNDQLLSQLAGFQGSLDALTAAVLSSPAFLPGTGDSGSGSTVPNGTPTAPPAQQSTPAARAPAQHHPAAPAQSKPPKPKPRPKPRPTRPVSGYNRRTRANLH